MGISPARTAAFDILVRIDRENGFASELLHSERLAPLSAADRGLAMEIVMGVLRWRSRLDDAIQPESQRPLAKLDVEVLAALRMAVYQVRFLSRIPPHAAINESVKLVKRAHKRSAAPFVNAVLRKLAPKDVEPRCAPEYTAAWLAGEFAHPQWIVERWIREFGFGRAQLICSYDQKVPHTAIRLDDAAIERELEAEGVELAAGALLANARIVTAGEVTRTRAFLEGRLFIQDEASQLVAALVGTGSRLLDCCAAPGGKTAALAARNPTAEIIAAELHGHRAELLRKRVPAPNVRVIQADALQLPSNGGFDRVLADVPCSGTGTLARNPEIKWRLEPSDLGNLHQRQVAILRAALRQIAPGGRVVYSTCSLEREECEAVVEEIVANQPQYALVDCREELLRLRAAGELVWQDLEALANSQFFRTIPGLQPCDGFFAAMLQGRC